MKEEKSKKSKIIIGVIAGISFGVFYFLGQQLFAPDLETEIQNAALELNKQTPIKVDDFTRLDSAAAVGKTNFIYYYSIVNLEKSEVDLKSVDQIIRPGIIQNVINSPELKIYRDNNITMDYKYYDKYGEFVIHIPVTPEIYNN